MVTYWMEVLIIPSHRAVMPSSEQAFGISQTDSRVYFCLMAVSFCSRPGLLSYEFSWGAIVNRSMANGRSSMLEFPGGLGIAHRGKTRP